MFTFKEFIDNDHFMRVNKESDKLIIVHCFVLPPQPVELLPRSCTTVVHLCNILHKYILSPLKLLNLNEE